MVPLSGRRCAGPRLTRKGLPSYARSTPGAFLWNGVHVFTDHRNLAYVFDPEACVTSVSKALAQRLEGWKSVLGQYRYTIRHIPGNRNVWGHLLSRWVSVPALPVRAVAVLVRVIRMIPSLPKLSFVKRNRKHLRRMARRCNR